MLFSIVSLPAVAVSDTNLDHMTQTEYAQNSVKILRQSEILPLFSKLDLKEEGEEIYIQYRLRRPSLVLWFVNFHLPNVIVMRLIEKTATLLLLLRTVLYTAVAMLIGAAMYVLAPLDEKYSCFRA